MTQINLNLNLVNFSLSPRLCTGKVVPYASPPYEGSLSWTDLRVSRLTQKFGISTNLTRFNDIEKVGFH